MGHLFPSIWILMHCIPVQGIMVMQKYYQNNFVLFCLQYDFLRPVKVEFLIFLNLKKLTDTVYKVFGTSCLTKIKWLAKIFFIFN